MELWLIEKGILEVDKKFDAMLVSWYDDTNASEFQNNVRCVEIRKTGDMLDHMIFDLESGEGKLCIIFTLAASCF